MSKKIKLGLMQILLCILMAGCSATSLRCGSDGESSYVDLINVPDNLPNQIKTYAELCNFSQGAAK